MGISFLVTPQRVNLAPAGPTGPNGMAALDDVANAGEGGGMDGVGDVAVHPAASSTLAPSTTKARPPVPLDPSGRFMNPLVQRDAPITPPFAVIHLH